MSLISCISDCVYQKDGICTLTRAASPGDKNNQEDCAYYIKPAKESK